jgi:carbonic anhydrase
VSETDRLVENSRAYSEAFAKSDLPRAPARKVAVVACMDARLDPARVLGLEEGDAHVIRNPGGIVGDHEIRALAISQHLMGTEEIVVLQHTDCGMQGFSDEEFAARLEADAGARPDWAAGGDLDLQASLARITESPFIPSKASVRGFVFDVATGELREVT